MVNLKCVTDGEGRRKSFFLRLFNSLFQPQIIRKKKQFFNSTNNSLIIRVHTRNKDIFSYHKRRSPDRLNAPLPTTYFIISSPGRRSKLKEIIQYLKTIKPFGGGVENCIGNRKRKFSPYYINQDHPNIRIHHANQVDTFVSKDVQRSGEAITNEQKFYPLGRVELSYFYDS